MTIKGGEPAIVNITQACQQEAVRLLVRINRVELNAHADTYFFGHVLALCQFVLTARRDTKIVLKLIVLL